MRYWTFDVCSLIGDFESNKKRLAAIQECMGVAEKYMEHPIGETSRGDWTLYHSVLKIREAEYQMYVDMVILGLNDLPEVERMVLQWWLIDHYDDERIREHCGIKNLTELNKIKKLSLTRFTNIVMPD